MIFSLDRRELPHRKNDVWLVLQENIFVKKQNEILKKELESISERLNMYIRKMVNEQKIWGNLKMYLKCSYKMLKKWVKFTKDKLVFIEKKIEQFISADKYN